jgi:hypothetical protein
MWVIMKSPLIIGVNYAQIAELSTLAPSYFKLLTNKEAIAINRDPSPQATLVRQYPSAAQQRGSGFASGNLQVTLQPCDLSRADQRFEPAATGTAPLTGTGTGTRAGPATKIKLVGANLCISEGAGGAVEASPCTASTTVWTSAPDEALRVGQSATSKLCMQANAGASAPSMVPCSYLGPLPPPLLTATFGAQVFIWGNTTRQVVAAGDGSCLTVGLMNYDPSLPKWVSNNGTLEHEVWMGELTPAAAATTTPTAAASAGFHTAAALQQPQQQWRRRVVVVLFNKGAAAEAVTAPPDLIGTDAATAPTAVRDVVASKDVDAIAPGGSLTANVPAHGTKLYILTFAAAPTTAQP